MARPLSRRSVLRQAGQVAAVGAAVSLLEACGGSSAAPTTTAQSAPSAAGPTATVAPAATATPVPQTLGGSATAAPAAASAPATTGTSANGTAAPNVAAPSANLADKQVYRFAELEPASFDPANSQEVSNLPQIFEGLVNVSWKDGTIEPAMAQSYAANSDATVWTFKMRPGVKWSDGTPLTAKDFEYAWRRVVDPKTASIYTASLANVKNALDIVAGKIPVEQLGAKALDDATFEVTLTAPAPYFPLLAASWPCYPTPKHVIDKVGLKWVEAANSVSNGPYILKDWKHDQLQGVEPNNK
jgi:oligopeptide transport system substrate-binding protein